MEQSGVDTGGTLDRVGMSASLACAVHCAPLPSVLAAPPAIGLAWLDSPWVDKGTATQHYLQASGAVVVASSHFLNRHFCRGCVVCGTATRMEEER